MLGGGTAAVRNLKSQIEADLKSSAELTRA
jgi:hypothetical protein